MAKSNKKHVSVNSLDNYISETKTFTVPLPAFGEETPIEITVKPRLTIAESIDFVNNVVSDVVDDDTGVTYCIKDFSIRLNTLKFYTNITIPQNLDKQYELAYSDIVMRITHDDEHRFKLDEYENLVSAVDKQIEFEKEKYLCELRRETEELIEETKIQNEQLVAVFSQFAKSFENIDPDQMAGLVTKLANMEKLDEKSIVDALVEKGDKNAGILEVE